MPGYLVPTNTVDQSTTVGGYNILSAVNSGAILQVVSETLLLNESTTTDGLVNSTYKISITPSSSSSKILVMMNFVLYGNGSGTLGFRAGIGRAIAGGAISNIFDAGGSAHNITFYQASGFNQHHVRIPLTTVDSPNTTQQVSYNVRYGSYGVMQTHLGNVANQMCNFTLMEIAG
jgi:hypothetical protein